MKPVYRRYARITLLAVLLLGLAGWLVPSYFSPERYRQRLGSGLEQVFHRRVTFTSFSLRLLPRPGFSVENVVLQETPEFGSEPFARIDRIECDVPWRSLWSSRIEFAQLRLVGPSFNMVRNDQGEWNVENLLLQSGVTTSTHAAEHLDAKGYGARELNLDIEDARVNFKVGANKKPFAVTALRGHLRIDPGRCQVQFRLAGTPLRTDLALPTPGIVELSGEWTPGRDLEGPIKADLQTRGALLYDWVPLITGKNPEIYGVLDANIHISGSWRALSFSGETRLNQLHRWEELPPADPMPWTIHFRGQFDRKQGRVTMETLEASFAGSHVHLSGSVDNISRSPHLDLVVSLERSRLEDLMAVARRFYAEPSNWGLKGRVDGMLAIQGTWSRRRYGGFVGAHGVVLDTPAGSYPVSELAIRINNNGARVAPFKVSLAPHVELTIGGAIHRDERSPHYELTLSAKSTPLGSVLALGRALGMKKLRGLDATGTGSATIRLAGTVFPFSQSAPIGQVKLRAARFLIPGLTEPLNIPRATIQVKGERIVVDPVVAVLGTSLFTGKLVHSGSHSRPWQFELRADNLSLEQGSLWFAALGRRKPLPLLERLPGLSTFAARRVAASNLFTSLSANGRFMSPSVTYRGVPFRDFQGRFEVSDRVIRMQNGKFRTGGGRGEMRGEVDFTSTPAHITADFSIAGVTLRSLASKLPPALHGAHATVSAAGIFETRGLSRSELGNNLSGQVTLRLHDLSFGDFDPLMALVKGAGWGRLEPLVREPEVPSLVVPLEIQRRTVAFKNSSVELGGAMLTLTGSYNFDGMLDLNVHTDLRNIRRRWLVRLEDAKGGMAVSDVHLSGPIDRPVITSQVEVSKAIP